MSRISVPEKINQRLQRVMTRAFAEVMAVAEQRNLRLRAAATVLAVQRVDAIRLSGLFP